jgi:hypothetical protein
MKASGVTWPNLFRVTDAGERWAAAPGGADAYTHVELRDDRIVGTTECGRTRWIDLASGEIVATHDG